MNRLAVLLPFAIVAFWNDAYSQGDASDNSDSLKFLPKTSITTTDSLIESRFTRRIDSLKRLNLPTDHYVKALDSIRNSGPIKDVQAAEARLASLEKRLTDQSKNLTQSIRQTQQQLNTEISHINNDISSITSDVGKTVPDMQLPSVGGADINPPTNGIALPQSPDLKSGNGSLTNFNTSNLGGDVKKELSQINGMSKEAKGYTNDIKAISTGNLDSARHLNQEAEKRAAKMAGLDDLKGKEGEFDKYKGMTSQLSDPNGAKELAKQQLTPAFNHFAGKEKELRAAMEKISRLKQKYPSINSLSEIPKRVPNPMHGKPLRERLVPGVTWQFQNKGFFTVDLAPTLSYKLTGRFTTSFGWNERINFGYNHLNFSANFARVYGPRWSADYAIGKGMKGLVSLEAMNALVPRRGSSVIDQGHREWIPGVLVGLKKDYKIWGNLKGNIQTLYNLADIDYSSSPYADKLQVRVGFELLLNKKLRDQIQIKDHFMSQAASILQLPKSKLTRYKLSDVKSMGEYYKNKGQHYTNLAKNVSWRQFMFGKDTLAVTKGIMKTSTKVREMRQGSLVYHIEHNKEMDEIYDSEGKLAGTIQKWPHITMASGKFYQYKKKSDGEWRYFCDSKIAATAVVTKTLKPMPSAKLDLQWGEIDAKDKPLLEMLCKVWMTRE